MFRLEVGKYYKVKPNHTGWFNQYMEEEWIKHPVRKCLAVFSVTPYHVDAMFEYDGEYSWVYNQHDFILVDTAVKYKGEEYV